MGYASESVGTCPSLRPAVAYQLNLKENAWIQSRPEFKYIDRLYWGKEMVAHFTGNVHGNGHDIHVTEQWYKAYANQ